MLRGKERKRKDESFSCPSCFGRTRTDSAPTSLSERLLFTHTLSTSKRHIRTHARAHSRVYNLYADYVLKNPFYELDMPIRCELFDLQLTSEVTGSMNG